MTRFAVSLGSNLGDRLDHLRRAVVELGELGEVTAISSLYETVPLGGPEQGPFLNAVVVVVTDLQPHSLLEGLQGIEREHDRERLVRWGPRTLDLDIVATDGPELAGPDLVIPHPASGERRFVVEPLAEIWPGAPVSGGFTAEEARAHVEDQIVALFEGPWNRT